VQQVRHDEAEQRVAQELERLVVARLAAVLVRAAAVGERAVEQGQVGEMVPQALLQGPEARLALG
jgi:hypothetical protein